MKYFTILLSIAFTVISVSCDKTDITDEQATRFVKYYSAGLNDVGLRVMSVAGGYFIIGNIETFNSGRDVCAIRTDKFGNTIDAIKTYGGAFDQTAHNVESTENGYLIVGSSYVSATVFYPYVVSIDSTGEELWSRVFDIPELRNSEVHDVLVHDNGDIALIGYISNENSIKNILYMRFRGADDDPFIDHTGRSGLNEEAFCFVSISDNLYLIGGYGEERDVNQNRRVLYLSTWRVGTSITLPVSLTTISTDNAVARDMTMASDGSVYVACERQDNGERDILLARISSQLEKDTWGRVLGERDQNLVSSLRIFGEDIFISGTAANESERGDMVLIEVGETNATDKYTYFGNGTTYQGGGFDFTNDNGIIITGANFVNENSLITLFKTDADGAF